VQAADAALGGRYWYPAAVMAILIGVPICPITEAAADLGVSRDTIERLIDKKVVAKYRRTGDRRTFVDLEQVRGALRYRRVSGPEPGTEKSDTQ